MARFQVPTRLGLTAAVALALVASMPLGAAHADERQSVQPRSAPTFIAGEVATYESCWRATSGQTVVLKYRSGASWIDLSRTRLKAVPGGCMKGYPLLATFTFTAPQAPRTYSFREDLLKKGRLPGATSAPYSVVIRQASTWSAAQQTCVDLIYRDSTELSSVTQQGPDRVSATTLQAVDDCVQRSQSLTPEYVNAWLSAYGLPSSDLPDAHRDLVIGAITPDTFVNQVVAAAQRRYAGIASMITRERSTATVLNAYARLVSDALEATISNPLTDPLLGPWLTTALPATRSEAERALRSDPRWEYTRRAFLEYAILGEELLCGFGFSCDRDAIARMRAQLAAMPAMVPRWPLF